ncbi:MAG: excinuclease ABC subunit UvrC [Candidatus Margulisbacteria bacterium]|nr:excinuclease ABC subunit UvrC [Candidatus Margulisiibacteriota bacterium]
MLDTAGKILYVGKAKNIKKRVSSYFSNTQKDLKTTLLVTHIKSIEILVTNSENQALILENKLIKAFKPRYNISLKDDKSYPYIKISTQEPFPKVSVTRQKYKDQATYFGPYASIGSTKTLQRFLNDLFPIRDCKQSISLNKLEKKCINLDIGRCLGPCIYKDIKPDYDRVIQELSLFLRGQNKTLLIQLRKEMQQHAKAQDYEKAAKLRDRIQKIEALVANRMVMPEETANIQLWVSYHAAPYTYVMVQTIVAGTLLFQRGLYEIDLLEEDRAKFLQDAFLEGVDSLGELPDEILCDESMFQTIQDVQAQTGNLLKQKLHLPQRGDKKQLLELAQKNAKIAIERLKLEKKPDKLSMPGLLKKMQSCFELKNLPTEIVGVDISHLQGTDIVASAVYFKDGKPDKSGYRRYDIATVSGKSNDPKSIYEVVYRRLKSAVEYKAPMPKLMLIDGGKAQLNFAIKAQQKLGLEETVDLLSLAKKDEEVYSPNSPNTIKLEKCDPILHLLQQVRDESHRFAVSFQRKKRNKEIKNLSK